MRFQVLDGWRGIAALLVAVERLHAHGVISTLPVVFNSYLFVDFFFVLSGFVIAHAYGARIASGRAFVGFAIRRFGRLWPLHAALLAAFVGLEVLRAVAASRGAVLESAPFTGDTSWGALAANLALVHALGLYQGLTWNMPSWSISTEFWTYLVFGLVCLTAPTRRVAIAAALVASGLIVVALVSPKAMDTTYDVAIFRCMAGFFAGTLTYTAYGWLAARADALRPRAAILEPLVVVLALAFVAVADRTLLSLAAPAVFSLLVLVFAFEAGPISRALSIRPVHAVGAWSYAIYMTAYLVALMTERAVNVVARRIGVDPWTTVVIDGVERRFMVFGVPGAADALVLAYLVVVVLVSWLCYRLVEMPSRTAFARWADRIEAGPAARLQRAPAE